MSLMYYLNAFGIFLLSEYSYSFFPFHTMWRDSNKAVQHAVPLIATHKYDKALIMIKK